MRLGIFGGTFNPIHKGHINASLRFYDDARLDKLLIIPDRVPPHKQAQVASSEHRLNMLHLVYDDKDLCGDRNIEISDIELCREGKSYTIVTLRELKASYPTAKLFLYTGSDMFYTLESWKEGDEILRMCSIYTAAREVGERSRLEEYADIYRRKYGTECMIGDFAPVVSSSTQIRDCFGAQNDKKSCYFTNNLLTDSVNRYIMENGLYRKSEKERYDELINKARNNLREYVTEKRIGHIIGVKNTAELLADHFIRLGAELVREKVILAALLHDITKYMDQEKLCRRYGITLSEDDKASMQTVHAITGAYFAREHYGADDEIFGAVKHHTVGNEDMTLTEKIIFVSDYCEESRTHEQCRVSREMILDMVHDTHELSDSISKLDLITADILGKTVKYLYDSGLCVHSQTLKSFRSIILKYNNDPRFRLLSEKYPYPGKTALS
ncbi:MAG: nicotinate (nicotinamide) nucleotide adenylyltransferase [Ruminococcaceae bacterium]|nr:nicotinate (nicotinamide) nucleotide adenylyltransferase [Oscillospiraceae bacterium]